jgi:hypothetical protein
MFPKTTSVTISLTMEEALSLERYLKKRRMVEQAGLDTNDNLIEYVMAHRIYSAVLVQIDESKEKDGVS